MYIFFVYPFFICLFANFVIQEFRNLDFKRCSGPLTDEPEADIISVIIITIIIFIISTSSVHHDDDELHYLAVCWQSQSLQCQTPNPKISWVKFPWFCEYFQKEKNNLYLGYKKTRITFLGEVEVVCLCLCLCLRKTKCHLVFQESKAVLSVPIVRLVLHPVEPGCKFTIKYIVHCIVFLLIIDF